MQDNRIINLTAGDMISIEGKGRFITDELRIIITLLEEPQDDYSSSNGEEIQDERLVDYSDNDESCGTSEEDEMEIQDMLFPFHPSGLVGDVATIITTVCKIDHINYVFVDMSPDCISITKTGTYVMGLKSTITASSDCTGYDVSLFRNGDRISFLDGLLGNTCDTETETGSNFRLTLEEGDMIDIRAKVRDGLIIVNQAVLTIRFLSENIDDNVPSPM